MAPTESRHPAAWRRTLGNLVKRCLEKTGRQYPPGYGFALTYLSDDLNPAHLRAGADKVVAAVFAGALPGFRKDADLLAYVTAQADAESFEDWAIEAAQLVLCAALEGHTNSERVMRLCGHPGY